MGYTLVPLGGFALLALPGLIAALYKQCSPAFGKGERYHKVQNAAAFWILFFFYTIYPAVSVQVVAPWNCHSVGKHGSYLSADFRETCPDGFSFNFVRSWAFPFILLYPIGIPAGDP